MRAMAGHLPPSNVAQMPLDRCTVMGVVNVTPDSFSDGGCYATTDAAVAHGIALQAAGADHVDVGGESTRPGAGRVDAETEARRVLPVVAELTAAGVAVSVATTVIAAQAGAWGVRVHDAAGSADAVRVVAALQNARAGVAVASPVPVGAGR
jgi:dihydropteroate synthase